MVLELPELGLDVLLAHGERGEGVTDLGLNRLVQGRVLLLVLLPERLELGALPLVLGNGRLERHWVAEGADLGLDGVDLPQADRQGSLLLVPLALQGLLEILRLGLQNLQSEVPVRDGCEGGMVALV